MTTAVFVTSPDSANQYDGITTVSPMEWDDASQGYVVRAAMSTYRVKATDWIVEIDGTYIVLTDSQYQILLAVIANATEIPAFHYLGQVGTLYDITDGMVWDTAKSCYVLIHQTGVSKVTAGAWVLNLSGAYVQRVDFVQEFLLALEDDQYDYLTTA